MPTLVSRGRGRRTINEINMVPFIDVMLVLLIIFMVSAPLITTGVVDLPSVGKAQQRPTSVIEIVVGKDESLKLRVDQQEALAVPESARSPGSFFSLHPGVRSKIFFLRIGSSRSGSRQRNPGILSRILRRYAP